MTLAEARMIRALKRRCTYRYLAEVFYPPEDPGHGNQGYGEDLCKEALEVLYPGESVSLWMNEGKPGEQFELENKSHCGEYFWWE